jgi:CO/xanthine dehydrogenase Mo-binding subunit
MVALQVIGKAAPRVDGVDKVTGAGRYAGDVTLPGTLWGKSLHSPHAHARIVRIDTSQAKSLPGVHAVITGEDVRTGLYGRAIKDVPVLALDKVRFAGERVAAVAADDEDIAQRALDLIEVEYEPMPAVFDLFEAMGDSAPALHPQFAAYAGGKELQGPANRYDHSVVDRGDIAAGFAAADLVVENTYRCPRVHQAYLEPHSVVVNLAGDDVQVWACGKAPYDLRGALAVAIAVAPERITINHSYIGGDFGGKATPADLPIAYYLARATGRPVRMVLDYLEEFMAANPRHEVVIRLKSGVSREGRLTAHQVQFFVNAGAYAGFKPRGVIGGAMQAAGPYRLTNCRVESTHVYTNSVPGGHMRAPGEPQALFALESHIDELARAIDMDPLAFRLANLVESGEAMVNGETPLEVRGRETLLAAVEAAGYNRPKPANVGRGIALGDRGPGGGEGNAVVTLHPDGSVVLGTPIFDQGSGTYTLLTQVVAEEMQVPLERVRIERWSTGAVPYDSGIGGMRGARVNSATAYEAASAARAALLSLAAEHLGWPEERLVLRGDEIRRTDQEETVEWPQLLRQAGRSVSGQGHVDDRRRAPVTSFTAQVAEVSVDSETGEVRLLRFTTAHDVGRIVNPVGHEGQINGGLMQGIGYALMEELQVEEGRVSTLSFGDYKIPTPPDIPPLNTVLVEASAGVGPYQIKGIGESSIGPVAPAIANAIADAAGVRLRELPLTAEKVYGALKDGITGR